MNLPNEDPSLDGAPQEGKTRSFLEYTSPFSPFQYKPFHPFPGISAVGALKYFHRFEHIVHFLPHVVLSMSKKNCLETILKSPGSLLNKSLFENTIGAKSYLQYTFLSF
jgi:hypothetical protein